jgi:hypothetical protein
MAKKADLPQRAQSAQRKHWEWESDSDGGLGTWEALGMKRSTLRVMRSGQAVDS